MPKLFRVCHFIKNRFHIVCPGTEFRYSQRDAGPDNERECDWHTQMDGRLSMWCLKCYFCI